MPFTVQQDTFIIMAHFRSGTEGENGQWTYSVQSCINQFTVEYPNHNIAYDTFLQHRNRLVKRFMETGSVLKRKRDSAPTILTENTVTDIQNRIEGSPHKSIRKLSAQSGVSYGSVHNALKKHLHMHPYKVSVLQQLYHQDFEQRINYCQWFNNTINNDEILDSTFYSDEAWFHLSGYVNSQNYRTWSTENPHVFQETSLHPVKIGVWIAMSRRRIVGPIFFNDTINAQRYRELILQPFINDLNELELHNSYFQQDGATPHTAQININYLTEIFNDRLISRGCWPARSPDLTPLDFFLFGYLKNRVFSNRLHNLEELQNAITHEVNNIGIETLQNVFNNMRRRVNLCLEVEGGHFEHLL